MQESTPLHGAIYAKILAEELRGRGYTEQQIFAGSGLNAKSFEDKRPSAPFGKVAAFMENAATLTDNDILGLEQGLKRNFHLSGLSRLAGE